MILMGKKWWIFGKDIYCVLLWEIRYEKINVFLNWDVVMVVW